MKTETLKIPLWVLKQCPRDTGVTSYFCRCPIAHKLTELFPGVTWAVSGEGKATCFLPAEIEGNVDNVYFDLFEEAERDDELVNLGPDAAQFIYEWDVGVKQFDKQVSLREFPLESLRNMYERKIYVDEVPGL